MEKTPFEGFSKINIEKKRSIIKDFCGVSQLKNLSLETARHLIENVIGLYSLPLAVAPHFFIDGKDYIIPMVIEESSVVAAVSKAAKTIRQNGGFKTQVLGSLSIGQIQISKLKNPDYFEDNILKNKTSLIDHAHKLVPNLVARGGGVTDIITRKIKRPDGETMGVLHLLCNTCDAMGANLINQICEGLKSKIENILEEKVALCILSNLTDTKLVEATCEIKNLDSNLAQKIEEATLFANLDPYRAATHNKGIMNGIDAVLLATGNDWRAVEAGVHAYASLSGKYGSLSSWKFENGLLKGKIKLPLSLGTVGGATKVHPTAKACLKMMGVSSSDHLSQICACVGLAQNFAALTALCQEGIIQGHMKLHSSNLAIAAGAEKNEIQSLTSDLQEHKTKSLSLAQKLLSEMRNKS